MSKYKRTLVGIIATLATTSCLPKEWGRINDNIDPGKLKAEHCLYRPARNFPQDTIPPTIELLRPSTKNVTLPPRGPYEDLHIQTEITDNRLYTSQMIVTDSSGYEYGRWQEDYLKTFRGVGGRLCEFSVPVHEGEIIINTRAIDVDGNLATRTDTLYVERLPDLSNQ